MTFTDSGLDARLLRAVEGLGFTQPTPIQRDAIPPAVEGRDVLACAVTGSGKTAAFGLPLLHRLLASKKRSATTRALILTPTRELAAQVQDHLRQLARHTPITTAAVFGGVAMGPQERALRGGVDVLVATPGRLLDHLQYPYARLDSLELLVLDEADRMLDMGFIPDVRRILARLPAERQTLFFSATLPPSIVQLSREMLRDPAAINIERVAAPAAGITHRVYPAAQTLKSPLLVHLLRGEEMRSVVVFTRTRHRANRLAAYLQRHGVSCEPIHGSRSQPQRTRALAGFKSGEVRVLVATDLAARGIDVEGLSHVINFDVPGGPEEYIHRVGRTARADATGDAITFVSPEEEGELRVIERALSRRLPRASAAGFDYAASAQEQPEVPIQERIARIRAQKALERARAAAKVAARASRAPSPVAARPSPSREPRMRPVARRD